MTAVQLKKTDDRISLMGSSVWSLCVTEILNQRTLHKNVTLYLSSLDFVCFFILINFSCFFSNRIVDLIKDSSDIRLYWQKSFFSNQRMHILKEEGTKFLNSTSVRGISMYKLMFSFIFNSI